MGRPSLTNPRDKVGSVRLTTPEADYLITAYGSVAKGLRALVAKEMPKSMRGANAPVVIVDEVQMMAEVKDHRHRRGDELDPVYEGGSKKRRFQCAEPDCEKVLS